MPNDEERDAQILALSQAQDALASRIEQLSEIQRGMPPIGSILLLAVGTTPAGYLPCDGRAVGREEFRELFAAIGEAWGPGDGATTFNLPDLRGVFLRALDTGAGRDAGRTLVVIQADSTRMPRSPFRAANAGGHTHVASNVPDHSHAIRGAGGHTHAMAQDGTHVHDIPIDGGAPGGPSAVGRVPDRFGVVEADHHRTAESGPHTHALSPVADHVHAMGAAGGHSHTLAAAVDHTHGLSGGDPETRPVNHALAAFIRT